MTKMRRWSVWLGFKTLVLTAMFFGFQTQNAIAQCNNNTPYGSATIGSTLGSSATIFCNYAGEYGTWNGIQDGYGYTTTSSVSTDFLTVRSGTPGGTVIASGVQPLTWQATSTGTYYIHVNTNSSCGGQNSCRNVTTTNLVCLNTTSYGSATIGSTPGSSATIFCNYAGEYGTWNGITAGNTYDVTSTISGDYLTIRSGTYDGPIVAYGQTPVSFTAASTGTHFIHVNSTFACGTQNSCRNINASIPGCLPPTALSGTPTSATSADLSWTAGGTETLWEVEVTASGAGQGTGISDTTSSNPVSITGLTANTSYDFYVRAICAPTDSSSWSTVGSFTTPCAPITAPFVEDFTGSSTPSCWTNTATSGGPWFFSTSAGYTAGSAGDHTGNGSNYAWVDFSGTDAGVTLTTPLIDVSTMTNPEFVFWLFSYYTGTLSPYNILYVERFDGTNWVPIDTLQGDNGGWTRYAYLATPYIFNTSLVQFRFIGESGGASSDFYNDLLLDDIGVGEAPTCPVVTNLATSNATNTGIDFSWTPGSSETLWEVEYVPTGGTLGTGVRDTTSSNPVTLTGLVGGYTYDFYVRGICTAGDSSFWEGPITATLPCTPFAGTYTLGSTGDFTSFTDLSIRLTNCGISGPVTVNVQPGTYPERLTLGAITGSSATNTITVNGGDTGLVTLTNGALATVDLEGTDYLTIKNMTIENTGISDAYGIRFSDTAENNTIDSNRFICNTASTGSDITPIVASASPISNGTEGQNAFYNTISNNHIIGGYYGVRFEGASSGRNVGNSIISNTFESTYYYAIYIDDQDSLTITNNIIPNVGRGTNNFADGIYCFDIQEFTITGNYVDAPDYACYIDDGNSLTTPNSRALIANNIFKSDTDAGLYVFDLHETDVWHNTIVSFGSTAFGAMYTNDLADVSILNNILYSENDYAYEGADAFSGDSANSDINNNVYWTPAGNTKFVDDGPSIHANLTAWQTALATENINSVESDPVFANAANGDYTPLAIGVDNAGTPVGILTDINGNPRSTTTPDAGAIEFTGIPGDLAITATSLKQVDACYGTADTAFATVSNVFGSAVNFATDPLTVYWQVNGPVNTIDSLIMNTGTLAVGADTTVFISTIDMSAPGTYMVGAAIGPNAANASATNDSIMGPNETVVPILSVQDDSLLITNNYGLAGLVANSPLFPVSEPFFTEISQYAYSFVSIGLPVPSAPTWKTGDDYVEITGIPGTDLGGYQIVIYNTSGQTGSTLTIPAGSILSPAGVATFSISNATPSPANYFYNAGDNQSSSGTPRGYTLLNPNGVLVDAVGYQGSSSYTFPASSGVTAADWSGSITGSVTSSWGIRLEGADVNGPTNWVRSAVSPQDPSTLNTGVTAPSAPSISGFDWSLNSVVQDTNTSYDAGPYMNDTVLTYIATFNSVCGVYTDSTVVTVSLVNAAVNAMDISCNGQVDGMASVSASGSVAPYSYLWSNGSMNDSIMNLMAGTYYVTVYDANGDSIVDSAVIVEPAMLMATAAVDSNASCNGFADGGATVTVTGGTMPYSYSWSNGDTTASASGMAAGGYSVIVTDANGCSTADLVTITEPTPLVVSASLDSNATACVTGGASGVASGGTAPYTYAWSDGTTTTPSISAGQGLYTLSVTDANGCVSTDTVTIGGPASAFVVTTQEDMAVSCNGLSDGAASAVVSGGATPYTYLWSTGATTASITGLTAGNYTVTVNDGVGCVQTSMVTVTEPNVLTSTVSVDSNVTCFGLSNGGASTSAMGGTMPYSYSWSSGDTTVSIAGLPSGTYSVTITDANGCTTVSSGTVTQPTPLLAVTTGTTNPLCYGDATGATTAQAAGGTAPYSFAWSNGATTASISGLVAGTYSVTVTDANGCTQTASANVSQPNQLNSFMVNINDPNCNGSTDGSALVIATGGTAPYAYAWSNGTAVANNTGIGAGTYMVTITDANGCSLMDTVTLTDPTVVAVSITGSTDVNCFGDMTGSASATGTGGTAPYVYNWSNGAGGSTATGLAAGTYTVTMTDANGCTSSDVVTINQPASALVSVASGTDALCNGAADGTASVIASGGTAPYTYAWDNAGTSASISGLAAGMYNVTVTDANGCTSIAQVTVGEPMAITTSLAVTDIDCNGDATGVVSASSFGGTAPFSYAWSTGATGDTLGGVAAGMYTVTVTDVNGCTTTAMATVDENDSLDVSVNVLNTNCENGSDGAINSFTIGGTPGYTFNWSNGSTDQNVSNLPEGSYSVTVTDQLGCSNTASGTVTFNNPLPQPDLGPDAAYGIPSLIVLNPGTPGDNHLWSDGSTNDSLVLELLSDTTIWVEVTSAAGCINSDTIRIEGLLGVDGVNETYTIKLFPNPTSGLVNIQVDNLNAEEVILQVVDFTGKLVMNRELTRPGAQFTEEIDLSNQSQGVYFVNIILDGHRHTQRVTVY